MIYPIAIVGILMTPIPTDPDPLCYWPIQKDCCEQIRGWWEAHCGAESTLCYGITSSHGLYVSHRVATATEYGYSLLQTNPKPNNSGTCSYYAAWCDAYGFCHVSEEPAYWQCKDEILTGGCFGG